MRIPFLAGGRSSGDDPEHKKLLVAEGRVPRPFPGPWTLRALVRGEVEGEPVEPSVKDAGGESSEGNKAVESGSDVENPATGVASPQDAP
jgi:hypothetical protein